MAKKTTNYLNTSYNVDIDIHRIGIGFDGDIELKNIFVRDHHQDTLLYATSIETSLLGAANIINSTPKLGDVFIENLVFYMKRYKQDQSDNLMVFVNKFDTKKTKEPSGTKFMLTTGNVNIVNGKYHYIDQHLISPTAVSVWNLDLDANYLKIEGSDVFLDIEKLSFKDHRGLDIRHFKSVFGLTSTKMSFDDLMIKTKDSEILGDVIFSYGPGDMQDFINKVSVDAHFQKASINTNDLRPFYKEFGKNQLFTIKKTDVRGVLNDFKVYNSNIRGLDRSSIRGNFSIKNAIDNVSDFKLDGDFTGVVTNYYDLINLFPNMLGKSLPQSLYKLGNVRAKGQATVTTKTVDVDMNLFSHLGNIQAFMVLGALDQAKNASYNGNIISRNFNIGKLLDKKSLGHTAFNIDVDGSGFVLDNLNTKLEGVVSKLEFEGYNYSNLRILGNLKHPIFDGVLIADDPNIKFQFNGVADVSEDTNNYDFKANVDLIDLKKLNIFTRDEVALFNGDVAMKMKGRGIDDAEGVITFSKTLYKNQNASYYFDDFEIVSSFDDNKVRTISMNSPDILQGSMKGVFRFKNLYHLFRNSLGSLYTNFKPTEITDNEFLEFDFKIYNKIVEVFFPDIEFAPNTVIRGNVASNESEFKLNFKSPSIKTSGNLFKEIDIQVDNKNPLFNTYVAVDSINTPYYGMSKFNLINVTLKDTLFMRSEFRGGKNNQDTYNLDFYHTIDQDNNSVVGIRKSDFNFKGYHWNTTSGTKGKNKIIFDKDFQNVLIKDVTLFHKEEKIRIQGMTSGQDTKDIKVSFNDVDLNKITPLLENLTLDGVVDGDIQLLQEKGVYLPSSTIIINDLAVNQNHLGEFRFNAAGNESLTQYRINSRLLNDQKKRTFKALGSIDFSDDQQKMDIDIELDQLDIQGFSELGGIVISDLRGSVRGDIKVSGNYKDPSIDGFVELYKAGVKVPYLNVDLDIEDYSKVLLEKNRFDFGKTNIVDTEYGTQGVLGGFIEHKRFSDWFIGLSIAAKDRLLVLNTQEDEESLYYGTGFIKGDATIRGPIDELVIDVNATTEKGTVFKIPLHDSESLGDNSYIHFLSPEEKQARIEGREVILEDIKGLELNFELDVNTNAEVEIVVDKSTGSSLRGRGAGTLRIDINTNGKFNMWGDFIAYEGSYNFRYGAFLEKAFSVKPGGSINWDGSPTRAILDLSAVYKTEANPAVLLDNATINRKIPVEVEVDLKGELIQPDIDFNIELPNLNSIAKSELEYRLEDQATKELQALSLVTQGQFYSGTLDPTFITGNLVERATGLVNGIFSGKDDKFKIGLNYDPANRNVDEEASDRVGVTVSTQINNKILINGRVGVPVGGSDQSTVTGDVEIEYLFNEDGSLRGQIFNRQNEIQNIGELQGHKQGVGLSYSVDFDNFNELWNKVFRSKKDKDTIPSKRIDSSVIEPHDFIKFTSEQK